MTYRETTVGEAVRAGAPGLEGYPEDMAVICDMPDPIDVLEPVAEPTDPQAAPPVEAEPDVTPEVTGGPEE